MTLPDQLIKDVEIEYLRLLVTLLKEVKSDSTHAKSSTDAFLKLLPFVEDNAMLEKLDKFGRDFPLFTSLHVYALGQVENLKTNELLEKMRGLMKDEKVNEAINLVQK